MNYYQHHLFFCTNQREAGAVCCGDHDAVALRRYAKERTKALGINLPGRVRVNSGGCMGRCGEGPIIVVYPEGTWYRYAGREDVDEIIERHLLRGEVVERLRI